MKKYILLIPLCCLFSCGGDSTTTLISSLNPDSSNSISLAETPEYTPVESFAIESKLLKEELKVEATGFAKMNEKAIEDTISILKKNKDLVAIRTTIRERKVNGEVTKSEEAETRGNIEDFSLNSYYEKIEEEEHDEENVYYNSTSNTYFLETLDERNIVPFSIVMGKIYTYYKVDALFHYENNESIYYKNLFKMISEGKEFYVFEMSFIENKYYNENHFLLVVDTTGHAQRMIRIKHNTQINELATDEQLTEDVKDDNEILVAGATYSSQEVTTAIQTAISDLNNVSQFDFKEAKPYKAYTIRYVLFNSEGYATYDFYKSFDKSNNPSYSITIDEIDYFNPFE